MMHHLSHQPQHESHPNHLQRQKQPQHYPLPLLHYQHGTTTSQQVAAAAVTHHQPKQQHRSSSQQPASKKQEPIGTSPSYISATQSIQQYYRFRELPTLIAKTNHSTVHKVFSNMYQREVAVKIIDKRSIPANLVDKFLPRELDITRIVNHPHIVRCLHVIQPNVTKVAIISEFYSGGTLLQYVVKRGKADGPNGARIFRQLCEAIHYLHDTLGVVHRDIKMENILLDRNGDVKLADFGFARYISSTLPSSTSFCGTRPYSSPQLVQQKPYNPFAADWYAAGVVLFTLLCGKWPHEPKEKCVFPLKYPNDFEDDDARKLIDLLMHPTEINRGGYSDIVNNQWLQKHTGGKWVLSNEMFVYEIEPPQNDHV